MRTRIVLMGALLLLSCSSAIAEVILTIDKPAYVVGEIVHIEAHNSGPEDEDLVSYPYFVIWNVDAQECVSGCVGLPVVDPFPAGETISMDWDTAQRPDPPGTYQVSVATPDGPSVSYVVTGGVPNDQSTWATLKARYR